MSVNSNNNNNNKNTQKTCPLAARTAQAGVGWRCVMGDLISNETKNCQLDGLWWGFVRDPDSLGNPRKAKHVMSHSLTRHDCTSRLSWKTSLSSFSSRERPDFIAFKRFCHFQRDFGDYVSLVTSLVSTRRDLTLSVAQILGWNDMVCMEMTTLRS